MRSVFGGPWSPRKIAIAILVLGLFLVIAIVKTAHQGPGSDFHARWMAGQWFLHGEPLYRDSPWVREASYPPFAAMVFQLFAVFPFRIAAAGFYFVNLVLTGAAVVLTRRIFLLVWPERSRSWWPLVAATVVAAQFLLNNLNLVQVNTALFVLCLVGILAHLKGRDAGAATAFIVAAFIKIVPVFFVVWLALRGRRRALMAIVPVTLGCLVLPMLQRGVAGGVRDLRDYDETFLQDFRAGLPARYNRYTNQNLSAAVYRLTQPPAWHEEADYRLVETSPAFTRAAVRVASVLIGLTFVAMLVWLRQRGAPVTVFEWSSAFLVGHLLSGITWKAHLVTLLFVFCALFSISVRELPRGLRVLVGIAIALTVLSGLSGRDLVGFRLHHWIGGYSLLAWTMVILFVTATALSRHLATQSGPKTV